MARSKSIRLQRYLAQTGITSRRRAEELIAGGKVSVNGKVVSTMGATVDPSRDRVEVEGRPVQPIDVVVRVMLKPRGCLATLTRKGDRPTLLDYLQQPEPGLQVVAPLDFPSEGVLLLMNDGELAQALSRRGSKVQMTYHLKLQGKVPPEKVDRLLRGWRWEGKTIRPETVEVIATTAREHNTWIEMRVAEPRVRALKAAGDVIRHFLLKVSRVALDGISFEGLKMGGYRELTRAELAALRQAAGLVD